MTRDFLPYGKQIVDDSDIDAVAEVLRSEFLTTGPAVDAFEEAFARRVGARYAVCCSSGTAALHLAALALELGEGDIVGVPAMTFLATANSARYVGAEVAFLDVDPDTALLDVEAFCQVLDNGGFQSLKAVFPVHYAGQCVNMAALHTVTEERGIQIVEDASHAVGSAYEDNNGDQTSVGSCRHSAMAIFSLHPVKTITMGEGGVVTTNDEQLYKRLRDYRSHGMTKQSTTYTNCDLAFDSAGESNPWYYEMARLGFNYRASDIHCALGRSQLGKLDTFVARRGELVKQYDRRIEPLAPILRPLGRVSGNSPAWHLYVVLIDFEALKIDRARLMKMLVEADVGSQVHYIPVHHQPYYRDRYGDLELSGADRFRFPCFPRCRMRISKRSSRRWRIFSKRKKFEHHGVYRPSENEFRTTARQGSA